MKNLVIIMFMVKITTTIIMIIIIMLIITITHNINTDEWTDGRWMKLRVSRVMCVVRMQKN